ncbi:MAG: hypothetical protein LBT96_02415 [Campylobacteraceae bacterium]|nr:hypothetical protein [Campylobacteraceae bacterium]
MNEKEAKIKKMQAARLLNIHVLNLNYDEILTLDKLFFALDNTNKTNVFLSLKQKIQEARVKADKEYLEMIS